MTNAEEPVAYTQQLHFLNNSWSALRRNTGFKFLILCRPCSSVLNTRLAILGLISVAPMWNHTLLLALKLRYRTHFALSFAKRGAQFVAAWRNFAQSIRIRFVWKTKGTVFTLWASSQRWFGANFMSPPPPCKKKQKNKPVGKTLLVSLQVFLFLITFSIISSAGLARTASFFRGERFPPTRKLFVLPHICSWVLWSHLSGCFGEEHTSSPLV